MRRYIRLEARDVANLHPAKSISLLAKIADIRADRRIAKVMHLKRAIKLSYLANVLTATGYEAVKWYTRSELDDFILDSGRSDDLIQSFKVY